MVRLFGLTAQVVTFDLSSSEAEISKARTENQLD